MLHLQGPLIIPGPRLGGWLDLRSTPARTLVLRCLLAPLAWLLPDTAVGRPSLHNITRCPVARAALAADPLRWTGGCKFQLLLAFVNCLDDNLNQLADLRSVF